MKYLIFILLSSLLISCQQKAQTNVNSFKNGRFKTILNDKKIVSFAIRNDSLQIETTNNRTDTFKIKWVNSFEYILLKKNPKDLLDSTPFHVKINSIKDNSYEFTAYYKGSNFKQKGKAIKLSKKEISLNKRYLTPGHPEYSGLDSIIGIDPRVEVLATPARRVYQDPAEKKRD